MSHRWLPIGVAASLLAAPLAAEAATGPEPGSAPGKTAAKAARKPTRPAAKGTKTHHAATQPASHAAPTASTHRSWDIPQAKTLAETPDLILNQRIKAALLSDLSSSAQEIIPATAKGVVTLTGTVKSPQQRARAEQVARKVRGVRSVKNKLAVKAGQGE